LKRKKLEEQYKDYLDEVMRGPIYEIVCRVFKALTSKKVITPAPNYKSSEGYSCVSCNYKANNGHLYFLNKSFFFIKKPPVYVRHDEIASVEFKRAAAASSSRSFDIIMNHRDNNTQHAFTSIDRSEYNAIFDWFKDHGLNLLNEEEAARLKTSARDRAAKPTTFSNLTHDAYMQRLEDEGNEDGEEKHAGGDEEDSEEDEDFEADEKADESSESDEDLPPEIDEDVAQKSAGPAEEEPGDVVEDEEKKQKKTKEKKRKTEGEGEASEPQEEGQEQSTEGTGSTEVEGETGEPMQKG